MAANDVHLNIRIPAKAVRQLDAIARRRGVSRSRVIRSLLQGALANIEAARSNASPSTEVRHAANH